ncbi:DUF2335 domain-containing protein [Escherichia sp. E3659]|uniref:DUF2335 domain-containing protein n=1 Tax=Escherichia sp. E3659 TaxID=2044462 RepID=UPI001F0EB971|nr:DUF2335 domain-containing protein [Escherichia sp. E3659]
MPDQKESENAELTSEEQKDNELVSRVIENPEVLNRVLDSPQGRAIVCQHFQGPVPPPSMLKEYEQLIPGLANRLVELTEKEQAHRHKTVADSIKITKKWSENGFLYRADYHTGSRLFWREGTNRSCCNTRFSRSFGISFRIYCW